MKTKFKIIGVVAAVALVVTAAYAATSAGSSSDPLVTLSYLTQVFTPQVEEDMEAMVSERRTSSPGSSIRPSPRPAQAALRCSPW